MDRSYGAGCHERCRTVKRMVQFRPEFTEVLVFDLEAFVPPADRRRRTGDSLAVNPYRPDHTLLGGVVYRVRPLTGVVLSSYEHHWIWEGGGDREVVFSLYRLFADTWRAVSGKRTFHADPVVAGVGIATFDLPFFMAKCLQYTVAPAVEVYETIGKMPFLDLSTAGIGFLHLNSPILHPCTNNELADEFLGERARKPTGKCVWDMADAQEYAAIAERCEGEVREMVLLMDAMLQRCRCPDTKKKGN